MLKTRIKRRADHGVRAIKRIAWIEADVAGLADEDLFDLADIFVGNDASVLAQIAGAEVQK